MPKIVYVGRKSNHIGKTLWEIVGNLKDYGVGRLVYRNKDIVYPEPSFDKIVKVETEAVQQAENRLRRVFAWVERVFRGRKMVKLILAHSATCKPDFILIPKDEEEAWYKRLEESKPAVRIYDPWIQVPPLLNLILKAERRAKGEPVEDIIKIRAIVNQNRNNMARLAEEGETPTHYFSNDFGESVSPSLFENIEACRPFFENRNPWEDERDIMLRRVNKKSL